MMNDDDDDDYADLRDLILNSDSEDIDWNEDPNTPEQHVSRAVREALSRADTPVQERPVYRFDHVDSDDALERHRRFYSYCRCWQSALSYLWDWPYYRFHRI